MLEAELLQERASSVLSWAIVDVEVEGLEEALATTDDDDDIVRPCGWWGYPWYEMLRSTRLLVAEAPAAAAASSLARSFVNA